MIVSGFHAIEEALKNGRGRELFLSAKNPRTSKLEEIARRARVKVTNLSPRDMVSMGGSSEEKALLETGAPARRRDNNAQTLGDHIDQWGERDDVLVLLLDGITDVHNFGAILRSADKFEVDLVITPKNGSAGAGEGAYRTSSGASEYVPQVVVTNLRNSIEELKEAGFWVYTADLRGTNLDAENLANGKVALIMGSEDKGPRALTSKVADGALTIPCGGHVDSLNVSVATGIVLYEVRRQQKFFK